jgi:hypothetical protein
MIVIMQPTLILNPSLDNLFNYLLNASMKCRKGGLPLPCHIPARIIFSLDKRKPGDNSLIAKNIGHNSIFDNEYKLIPSVLQRAVRFKTPSYVWLLVASF